RGFCIWNLSYPPDIGPTLCGARERRAARAPQGRQAAGEAALAPLLGFPIPPPAPRCGREGVLLEKEKQMFRRILLGGVTSSFVALAGGVAQAVRRYGDEMDEDRAMQAGGTSFDSYLAREYRDFFLFDADEMYDWIDADCFAAKALRAERGGVMPENPEEWNVDEAH